MPALFSLAAFLGYTLSIMNRKLLIGLLILGAALLIAGIVLVIL